jgi:hypothetical protein
LDQSAALIRGAKIGEGIEQPLSVLTPEDVLLDGEMLLKRNKLIASDVSAIVGQNRLPFEILQKTAQRVGKSPPRQHHRIFSAR